MFARFRGFRHKLRKNKDAHQDLTVENSGLNKAQIDTAFKALRVLGLDNKQQNLSKQDFILFLYAMGLNPTDDMIDSKIRSFRLHHQKAFTFGQLAHIWYSMLQDLTDEEEILKRAFQFFDKDGNGEISVQELRTTMHELGDLLSEEEIIAFMEIMDVNNDGVIGYQEFLNTLKTQAPELAGVNHKAKTAAEHSFDLESSKVQEESAAGGMPSVMDMTHCLESAMGSASLMLSAASHNSQQAQHSHSSVSHEATTPRKQPISAGGLPSRQENAEAYGSQPTAVRAPSALEEFDDSSLASPQSAAQKHGLEDRGSSLQHQQPIEAWSTHAIAAGAHASHHSNTLPPCHNNPSGELVQVGVLQ